MNDRPLRRESSKSVEQGQQAGLRGLVMLPAFLGLLVGMGGSGWGLDLGPGDRGVGLAGSPEAASAPPSHILLDDPALRPQIGQGVHVAGVEVEVGRVLDERLPFLDTGAEQAPPVGSLAHDGEGVGPVAEDEAGTESDEEGDRFGSVAFHVLLALGGVLVGYPIGKWLAIHCSGMWGAWAERLLEWRVVKRGGGR